MSEAKRAGHSDCCNAPTGLDWSGREIGRKLDPYTSCWCRCLKCGKPCNQNRPKTEQRQEAES